MSREHVLLAGCRCARGAAPLLLLMFAAAPLLAQVDPAPVVASSTFEDESARRLQAAAREVWLRVERDVLSYTAVVRQRAAAELRLPLKDRTLFRGESASRVFWSRDGSVLVQALASRVWHPGPVDQEEEDFWRGPDVFDPAGSGDRLSFGMMGDQRGDVWFEHPLGRNAAQHYRFRTGDTLTITFPDGRQFRSVELQVIPLEAHIRRITGSLWIDPESGVLVRAAYRLSKQVDIEADMPEEVDEDDLRYVPGLFKPFTFDVTLITVDYALWDFRVWLPRSFRAEGVVAAGIIKVPAALELSYDMESVVLASNDSVASANQGPPLEERHFRTRSEALAHLAELAGQAGVAYERDDDVDRDDGRSVRYLVPQDRAMLPLSPDLPPPIWEDGPGFLTGDQLDELTGLLDDLPVPVPGAALWAFNWGPQRPDLLRYNRIEGPAVGARFQMLLPTPAGPVSTSLTPFFGVLDVSLKARLAVERETLRRKLALGLYRELEPVSRAGRYLGIGNSLNALLFGRDDGDYFMATGAELRVTPPTARRRSWELRLYAEQHDSVETSTDFSIFHVFDGDWAFRPNLQADELSEVGAALVVSPWWGTDPLSFQSGAELYAQGATGTYEYARASLTLRSAVPFFGGGIRIGAEVGAGESWGEAPVQRSWFLGGPQTLRGYSAASLVGPSFARGRFEVARVFAGASFALFGDAGWTGPRLADFSEVDALYSVGAGFSLLDGVIRLDVAKGLRGRRSLRWDLYLDGIL